MRDVLLEFLQRKGKEGEAVLAADKTVTEQEKKAEGMGQGIFSFRKTNTVVLFRIARPKDCEFATPRGFMSTKDLRRAHSQLSGPFLILKIGPLLRKLQPLLYIDG